MGDVDYKSVSEEQLSFDELGTATCFVHSK